MVHVLLKDMYILKSYLAIGNNNTSSIEGIKTLEPTFGLPARWIDENQRSNAKSAGYTVVGSRNNVTYTYHRDAEKKCTGNDNKIRNGKNGKEC